MQPRHCEARQGCRTAVAKYVETGEKGNRDSCTNHQGPHEAQSGKTAQARALRTFYDALLRSASKSTAAYPFSSAPFLHCGFLAPTLPGGQAAPTMHLPTIPSSSKSGQIACPFVTHRTQKKKIYIHILLGGVTFYQKNPTFVVSKIKIRRRASGRRLFFCC